MLLFSLWATLGWAQSPAVASRDARDLVEATSLPIPALPEGFVVVHRGAVTVAYPRDLEGVVGPTVARVERDVASLSAQFGLLDIPPLEVRLVATPEAMRALSPVGAPPPAYASGVAYPGLGLALVSASAPRTWEASEMPRVLRHELSHLLLGAATGGRPVPRWLAEGLAVHQAGENSFERFLDLAEASATGSLVSFQDLDRAFGGHSREVSVAYAESADVVGYLLRLDGPERLPSLLASVRSGRSFDQAVEDTWGRPLARIERGWREDAASRLTLAPLWAGGGVVWTLGVALLVAALVKQRRRRRELLARWEREERGRRPPLRLLVFSPGRAGRDTLH
ncbi:MAG: hypothetical protein HY909_07510 [Deltaproteobacteria bacterium]|nr:hypothetical protein [Deltaproteobacteria bacterium]